MGPGGSGGTTLGLQRLPRAWGRNGEPRSGSRGGSFPVAAESTGEEVLPEAAERAEVMVTTVLWWGGQEQGKTLVPWPSQVRRRFILQNRLVASLVLWVS